MPSWHQFALLSRLSDSSSAAGRPKCLTTICFAAASILASASDSPDRRLRLELTMKNFKVLFGIVALVAVASITVSRATKTASGGNIGSRPAQTAKGGNIGSGPAAVDKGENIGSRQLVVADATPSSDIVAGNAPTAAAKAAPPNDKTTSAPKDSEPKDREKYRTGYGIQEPNRTKAVEDADSLSDPPGPATKAPEPKTESKPEAKPAEPKEPRSGDRDPGGSSGGSGSSGGGPSSGGRDFSKGHAGDSR